MGKIHIPYISKYIAGARFLKLLATDTSDTAGGGEHGQESGTTILEHQCRTL